MLNISHMPHIYALIVGQKSWPIQPYELLHINEIFLDFYDKFGSRNQQFSYSETDKTLP